MELYVAGGTSEHGRNCFYVKEGKTAFLVDCGIMKEDPEKKYPILDKIQIRSCDYLFITHNHADHAGAILWLYENGFRGKVVASAFTLSVIPGKIRGAETLESLGKPKSKIQLKHGITLMYGRSGHCAGSVWLRFSINKSTILFSGDYCENSVAYKCDRIRKQKADLAVIDSAYGYEKTDAKDHLQALDEGLRQAVSEGKTMLFPVPVFGRGLDLIKMLVDLKVPVYAGSLLYRQVSEVDQQEFWYHKKFPALIKSGTIRPLSEFQAGSGAQAVIVTDSQLADEGNQSLALRIVSGGGSVILTGKQDPASFSRMLIDTGRARFLRISVHQNVAELKKLDAKNSFRAVIPYHCRDELKFEDQKYRVMRAGERSVE